MVCCADLLRDIEGGVVPPTPRALEPWLEGGVLHRPLELPDGRIRRLVTLGPALAGAYATAVLPALPRLERRLGSGVHSDRLAADGVLEPPGPAWARWRRAVGQDLARGGVVVRGDVRDCYGSIAPAVAARALGAVGIDATPLFAVLERTAAAGVRGIPVGPHPSALLANAVLAASDEAVLATGALIHRWVDDVVIVGRDRVHAARALDAWVRALGIAGLSAHEGKTGAFVTFSVSAGLTRAPGGGYRAPAHPPRWRRTRTQEAE
jgi:hypothetical protein